MSELKPVPESVMDYENNPDSPPPMSLDQIHDDLKKGMAALIDALRPMRVTVTQTSGFRPPDYQEHLYRLMVKWIALEHAFEEDEEQRVACADLKERLDKDIEKHRLKTAPEAMVSKRGTAIRKGQPLVNPPGKAAHELLPARAIDLSIRPSITQLPKVALDAGLVRPCAKDLVHYSTPGLGCQVTAIVTAKSPVRLLVVDPLRRRLGFDASTRTPVNEIGAGAHYSNGEDGLEFLAIAGAVPGSYRITGVSTEVGHYEVSFATFDEAGNIRLARAWSDEVGAPGVTLPTRHIDTAPTPPARPVGPALTELAPVPAQPVTTTPDTAALAPLKALPSQTSALSLRWVVAGVLALFAALFAFYRSRSRER